MDEDKGEEWLHHDMNTLTDCLLMLYKNNVNYNKEGLPFTTITIYDFALKYYDVNYNAILNELLLNKIRKLILIESNNYTSRFYYKHFEFIMKQRANYSGDKIQFTFTMLIPITKIASCA